MSGPPVASLAPNQSFESGRWESNPLPSPWQGDVLPMNYARIAHIITNLWENATLDKSGIAHFICTPWELGKDT